MRAKIGSHCDVEVEQRGYFRGCWCAPGVKCTLAMQGHAKALCSWSWGWMEQDGAASARLLLESAGATLQAWS